MKNIALRLAFAATTAYLFIGTASAEFCGSGTLPPCKVPEPGTPYLILGALGVAAAIVKFRKK